MSDDGRFVAFSSGASNMHPSDRNGALLTDVFLYDRKKGETQLVSSGPGGDAPEAPSLPSGLVGAVCWSLRPVFSGDGRYVAFTSRSNLAGEAPDPSSVDALTMPFFKVYVRNIKSGKTEAVPLPKEPDGSPMLADAGLLGLSLNENGSRVAFNVAGRPVGQAGCRGNLPTTLPGDVGSSDCPGQVFLYDRPSDELILVSRDADGELADGTSQWPSLSDNGRFVAFESFASDLDPMNGTDLNNCHVTAYFPDAQPLGEPSCQDVYLLDVKTDRMELVSINREGQSGNEPSAINPGGGAFVGQKVSASGRFVLFNSPATDLIPNPGTVLSFGTTYIRDHVSDRTTRVSVSSTGRPCCLGAHPSISDDGRFVHAIGSGLCSTNALNPAKPRCDHEMPDVQDGSGNSWIHDSHSGQTNFVKVYSGNQDQPKECTWSLGDSCREHPPNLSGNGRYLTWSGERPYVRGDENESYDVFVRDIGVPTLGVGAMSSPFSRGTRPDRGVSILRDANDDASLPDPGAEILSGVVIYRPELNDLYIKIDVKKLSGMAGGKLLTTTPFVYGVRFEVGRSIYEVRSSGSLFGIGHVDPAFGLFLCDGQTCSDQVAELKGGYGTTGENVVVALPSRLLHGARNGSPSLSEVRAFSALGTYSLGAIAILDEMTS